MGIVELFALASTPVLKLLLIASLGSLLALDRIDVLGERARNNLNAFVFYIFTPCLAGSNLAATVTIDSLLNLWFMPVNILITSLVGLAFGWVLVRITRVPRPIKGLVMGTCSAGNSASLQLIVIPSICQEKRSPFGAPDVCLTYGLAYVSLAMAIGEICKWSYVYYIIRVSSSHCAQESSTYLSSNVQSSDPNSEPFRSFKDCNVSEEKMSPLSWIMKGLRAFKEKINLKDLLAPTTIGAIVGFFIGMVPQLRSLLVKDEAPLRIIQSSALSLGETSIPALILIMGGNLLRGLKGSGIQLSVIVGIITIRYVCLPVVGVFVVESAVRMGLLTSDPLYRFVLLFQCAVPPAMDIGTMTQMFGAGQSECSVIMMWSYALASVFVALWSTFFLWLVT